MKGYSLNDIVLAETDLRAHNILQDSEGAELTTSAVDEDGFLAPPVPSRQLCVATGSAPLSEPDNNRISVGLTQNNLLQ